MANVKRITACVLAAAIVIALLNIVRISPSHFSTDSLFVDDEETADRLDEEAVYEELFAPDSVVDISVDISKEQLADLQADYEYFRKKNSRSSVYRICTSVTISVNGKKYVVDDVGLRLKGTSSRCSFYNDILGIYNLVNFRMSFGCTFDDMEDYGLETRTWQSKEEKQKREKRTFATLGTLELKWNITGDNTYVRNRYVQEMFAAYGVPAQKCTLCTFSLGGCKLGIYRLFEPVDENFIHRYFPEEDWGGDLYKVRCVNDMPASYSLDNTYGVGNKKKVEEYNFDLKTNIGKSRHESIRRFLEGINRPDASKEDFDALMDMDELARVQAINFAVCNQDDMRINYNNHYIYFRKSDGKAVIIPYDNEIVLGITHVLTENATNLTEQSPYFEYNFRYDSMQAVPMLRQTVLRGGYFTGLYTDYLREIAESEWMTEAHYLPYFNRARTNYTDKLISRYNFFSTMNLNLAFSMDGGEDCNGNMSVAEYFDRMKHNILSGID